MAARKKRTSRSSRRTTKSTAAAGQARKKTTRSAKKVATPAEPRPTASSTKASSSRGIAKDYCAYDPYPYSEKMNSKEYNHLLRKLQIEMLKVQYWAKDNGQKLAVVFEGRDAAGKGGTIKRFNEHLNPRGSRVIALSKPNETEVGQWYFQRYITQLPTKGEITFWDRSWYNRAGVEPVMGFCSPDDYQRFMHQVPGFEQALIESGLQLFKLWFDVSQKEQKRRIEARKKDPLKRWKLSPMDFESIAHFDEYTKARDVMFLQTDMRESPWYVIRSDDKKRARIGAMQLVLSKLDYPDKDIESVTVPDPRIVGRASDMFPMEGRGIFDVRQEDD